MLGLCSSSSSVCDDHLFESHRAKKVKSGGSDPTFLRAIRPKVSWGSLPPLQALRVDELRGDCAGPRFCQTRCLTLCKNRKEKSVVDSEITTKATKGRHRPSPCRRIGKDSAGALCGVYRCFAVLRNYRSSETALPQGRRLQTLGRTAHKQPQQRKSQRRGSCEVRLTNMNSRPTQFGARENTASPRQHASSFATGSTFHQSRTPLLSECANRRSLEQMSQAIEIFNLSLVERPKEATCENNGGTGNTANDAIGHSNQADIELGLRTDFGNPLKNQNRPPADRHCSRTEYAYCGNMGAKQERSNLL